MLRRFLTKIHNADSEADQSSTENDRTPPYNSNVRTRTEPSHTLPGRHSVAQPGSSLTETLGVEEASQVASPNYSKRLSGSYSNSDLCEFC